MQRWHFTPISFVVFNALLVASCGCGDSGDALQVTGTVTLDGEPLPDGLITILPIEDGKANSGDIVYKTKYKPGIAIDCFKLL